MRSRSIWRFFFSRPSGAPWFAAWVCLFAMAAQLALPLAHEIEESAEADGSTAAASCDPSDVGVRVSDPAGRHAGHVHDESTCPICRALSFARSAVVPTPPAPTLVGPSSGPPIARAPARVFVAAAPVRSWTARAPPAA